MPKLYTTIKQTQQIPKDYDSAYLELRLDCLELSIDEMVNLGKRLAHPPIFSNRVEAIQKSDLSRLAQIGHCDIDFDNYDHHIDYRFSPLISWHHSNYPKILPDIHDALFKICPKPSDMPDCFKFLQTIQAMPEQRLIAYARGERYQFTRHLAIASKQPIHFMRADHKNTDAQLAHHEVIYDHPCAHWLAVIGHPISHSMSPDFHNRWLRKLNLPGIYVAIDILPDELETCWSLLQALPFSGLSVTTPHKNTIAKILNHPREIVNTLIKNESNWRFFNTDVSAFKNLHNNYQSILILGAGDVACAVASTLSGPFYFWNRAGLSHKRFISRFPNARAPHGTEFDLIFSTLPHSANISLPALTAKQLIECQYTGKNQLNILATDQISGEEFFFEQARKQQDLFMNIFSRS